VMRSLNPFTGNLNPVRGGLHHTRRRSKSRRSKSRRSRR